MVAPTEKGLPSSGDPDLQAQKGTHDDAFVANVFQTIFVAHERDEMRSQITYLSAYRDERSFPIYARIRSDTRHKLPRSETVSVGNRVLEIDDSRKISS